MWQDQGVEMPAEDETGPKSEILRTLIDFRHEVREALGKMVRSDVYLADLRTNEVKVANLTQDIQRLDAQQRQEIGRLDVQLREERNDRRSLRNIVLTAVASSIVALIGAVVSILVK